MAGTFDIVYWLPPLEGLHCVYLSHTQIHLGNGCTIAMTKGEFHLQVHVVKPTTRGHLHHAAVALPNTLPSTPQPPTLPPPVVRVW